MDTDPRSLARLLGDALDQFAKLLRSEIAVARAELGEKLTQAVTGAGLLAVAGVLLIPVAVVLMLALAAWFAELGLRSSLAHFSAGLIGLVVVAILGLFGKSKVTPGNLALTHTKDEMARDADAGKRAI